MLANSLNAVFVDCIYGGHSPPPLGLKYWSEFMDKFIWKKDSKSKTAHLKEKLA
jgi:hypothetical protein